MTLQTGSVTPADDTAFDQFEFLKFTNLTRLNRSKEEFDANFKEAKKKISNGEIFANTKPEDALAKITTEAHWARVDFKRGYVNLKNAAKNKDWEAYEKYKAQMKNSFASLDRMIKALDDTA